MGYEYDPAGIFAAYGIKRPLEALGPGCTPLQGIIIGIRATHAEADEARKRTSPDQISPENLRTANSSHT